MNSTALAPITINGVEYADFGYCYEAVYDGPVVHTVYCRLGGGWGDPATSNSECIRQGQDGAAIRAAREAAADRRRFTPPEFRGERTFTPGPAIRFVDTKQRAEVVALRGRPRGSEGEWTTWEVYDQPMPKDLLGSLRHMCSAPSPRLVTRQEAQDIVAEFSRRLPHYEFKVVAARLVVEEERLA